MKAEELRIGNLVKGKEINVYWTVEAIDSNSIFSYGKWRSLDAFEPIPLTEEWLLKFGFEFGIKLQNFVKGKYQFVQSKNNILFGDFSENGIFYFNGKIKIHHVNQLQNLYHALTGEELTLKNQSK
jgi:hypothetical protein